jgi:hypothetical protein
MTKACAFILNVDEWQKPCTIILKFDKWQKLVLSYLT